MADAWPGRDWLDVLDRHGVWSGRLSPDTASLSELMNTYRVPGISIAVGYEDGRIWSAGYGTTGAAVPAPVDARTIFQACSISKHVATFGVLRSVADGRWIWMPTSAST